MQACPPNEMKMQCVSLCTELHILTVFLTSMSRIMVCGAWKFTKKQIDVLHFILSFHFFTILMPVCGVLKRLISYWESPKSYRLGFSYSCIALTMISLVCGLYDRVHMTLMDFYLPILFSLTIPGHLFFLALSLFLCLIL